MSTETKTLNAVRLPCPRCGQQEAGISVNLWTLNDPQDNNFTCGECGEHLSINEVLSLIEQWQKLLKWLEQLPIL